MTAAPPVVRDQPRPPDGPPGVWAIAWPTMTLFGLHALVGIVDFVFVGSLGTEAVAAVGVANQIHFLAFAVMTAVTAGTTAVVAREWGRGDPEEAARATRCGGSARPRRRGSPSLRCSSSGWRSAPGRARRTGARAPRSSEPTWRAIRATARAGWC